MRFLPWDSDHFETRIGRLDEWDDQWREQAEAQRIDCLYFLVDASNQAIIDAAQASQFRLVDMRVTLSRVAGRPLPALDPRVRPARSEDSHQLQRIAECSHHDTRFYADPGFARDRVDEMYRIWIRRSCARAKVWVWDEGEGASGYATAEDSGEIGLVAVSADVRGKGVGAALVTAALISMYDLGIPVATVVTQGRNVAGQRLYQRVGFTSSRVELWYHRWIRCPLR
jgi:GNAT superfamily N-acetyltransferase